MIKYWQLGAAASVAAGLMMAFLAGCQNSYKPAEATRPAMMSNRPDNGSLISPDMERFDANIGDTGTRTGGGGDGGQ